MEKTRGCKRGGSQRGAESAQEIHPQAWCHCWEDFLRKASGEDRWEAQRYISPREATAIPTISHQGKTTSEHQDKVDMLAGISFSPPVPSDGDRGQGGPTGQAFERVNNLQTRKPFQDTSSKSALAPMASALWSFAQSPSAGAHQAWWH